MNLYADYEYYTTTYKGSLSKEEFEKSIMKSSAYVRRITFGRADNCTEMEEVKLAVCAVCDVLISDEKSRENNSGRQIASESTDGYSVSYVQEKSADETSEELSCRKACQAAELYLEPTGLLYAGVEEC